MVKSLQDYCLACIARNVSSFNRLGNFLSRRHKELLLERMCWHGQLTQEHMPSISYHLFSHTLQRVNFSYSTQVNDKTLEVLTKSGCLPTSITIHDCANVMDKGIKALARILRKTEELNLRKLKQVTNEAVKSIASHALTSLNLRRCDAITDVGLVALLRNCPNVSKLNLCELHKLSNASIICAAEVLGNKLIELDVTDLNLLTSASTLALAKHCKNLSVATFEGCVRLDGTGLVEMAEQCSLTSLGMSFCYKVLPQQMEILISLLRAKGSVHTFEAMGISISPLGMEMLASASNLTHVSLCGVPGLTDEMVELITSTAGETLVELDISTCLSITDLSCVSISRHCKSLELLGLRNLREIEGKGLTKFFLDSRAKNFRSVTLSGSKRFSANVVETIVTQCPNLEVITMAGLKDITDDIVFSLAHHCPHVQYISLRNCDLTDAGVCEIAVHCSKLQMIALSGIHGLTDKCIIALAENCPYIEELYISGCAKITKQAIVYLQDCAVNRVFVNHSTPNAPMGLLMAKDLDTGEYTRVDDMEFPPLRLRRL